MKDCDIVFTYNPYNSAGESVVGTLAGDADFVLPSENNVRANVKDSKMRLLTITGGVRNTLYPDVPYAGELGFKQLDQISIWRGLFCKAGTDPAIISMMSEINEKIVNDPRWTEYIPTQNLNCYNIETEAFTKMFNDTITQGKEMFANAG